MQANENIAEVSTRAAKSLEYTPGVVSFYSPDNGYTGGIMPDQCVACVNYLDNTIAVDCPTHIELRIAPESSETENWFTLSKKSGSGNDTISVEAQPNAQRYCREGTITVKSGNGNISKQVKVLQYGAATYKLTLTFVGIPEGNSFKISSCMYVFMNDAAEDENSSYEIRVKLLNDGLPFQFPDNSSELVLPATIKKGSTVSGPLSKVFTTPFKINSTTALSFNTITATSVAGKGDVYVSKDTSKCTCIEEKLVVNTSSISAPADGTTSVVNVVTLLSVTWTVE